MKTTPPDEVQSYAQQMKGDWDTRARQDAKWFINSLKLAQTEAEFDQTGAFEVERLVLAELAWLTNHRPSQSLRILEIGCGVGRMTKHLATHFGEVIGVDVSGEMIEQARARLQSCSNVRLYETDGLGFARLPDHSVDVIFSAYVFQHVPSAAAITANLRDAWRVLRPGGTLKFQLSSVATSAFAEIPKDTWVGAALTETELRQFAIELKAQMIYLLGAGTQYCWTLWRKHPLHLPNVPTTSPVIERVGRADDFNVQQVPVTGEQAHLGLLVAGLNMTTVDINTVTVEINGFSAQPQYVGPAGQPSLTGHPLIQINQQLPAGLAAGVQPVRIRLRDGCTSDPVNVTFINAPAPPLKLGTITNTFDNGTDIYARGVKAQLRILVEGLDEAATPANVRVQLGAQFIPPSRIAYLPHNDLYQVEAALPPTSTPGLLALSLHYGSRQSPCTTLELLPTKE